MVTGRFTAGSGSGKEKKQPMLRKFFHRLLYPESLRWQFSLALLAGSVLMAWLISRFFIGRFVVGRLEEISTSLRFEKTGIEPFQVPVKGDDEIGRMARAVEQFLEAHRLLLETQQRLRQSENMLQTIVNAAPISIFGLDPDGNVHSVCNAGLFQIGVSGHGHPRH